MRAEDAGARTWLYAALAGWDLVRLGRLSVVPTDAAVWKRVIALGDAK